MKVSSIEKINFATIKFGEKHSRKRGSFMTARTISSIRANGPSNVASNSSGKPSERERERASSCFLPTFQLANMAESVAGPENTAIEYTAAVWPVGTRPFSGRKLSRRRLVFQKAAVVKQRECSGVATPASLRAIGTGPSILVFATTPPVLLLSICAPCFYPLTYPGHQLFFSFFSSRFSKNDLEKSVALSILAFSKIFASTKQTILEKRIVYEQRTENVSTNITNYTLNLIKIIRFIFKH